MGMLREAMSDMAETIRRVFQAPATKSAPMPFSAPGSAMIPTLEVITREPPRRFEPKVQAEPVIAGAQPAIEPMTWPATVLGEPGWAAWSTDATVCQLPLFRTEKCQRLEVPGLPRKANVRRASLGEFGSRWRSGWNPFAAPQVRTFIPRWTAPAARSALEQILTLPVAVTPEDRDKLSKALWMRYTLQLVRSTGQNIRNLEILGLYRIPAKGTRQVRHEPATGRLLVNLGPEAVNAKRAPFILARQKDDNAVVCCFVEET